MVFAMMSSRKGFQLFIVTAALSIVGFFLTVDLRLTLEDANQRLPQSIDRHPTSKFPFNIPERGRYIRVGQLEVALVTAVYYNDFPAKGGFNVFLNGWARYKYPVDFKCCFLNNISNITNTSNIVFVETMASLYHMYSQWKVDMQNAEFSCSISKKQLKSLPINKIAKYLTFAERSCKNASSEALRIEYRKTIPNSVGICLKISYGSVNPELVVEWFEYQRLMGVTKVYTFLAMDIGEEAKRVFNYYQSIGFLEADTIHPAPRINGTNRGFKKPRWDQQAWVDEVMAINDCKHRMAGLSYIIVHDIDEFILPAMPDDNIYTILNKTSSRFPDAGAFNFGSYVTPLDWGPTRLSPLHILRTTNRTSFMNWDGADRNTRWGFISDRIFFAQNNRAWPKVNYRTARVDNNLYKLIHRRECKDAWIECNSTVIRVPERSWFRYEKKLIQNIQKLPLTTILGRNSTVYIADMKKGKQTMI